MEITELRDKFKDEFMAHHLDINSIQDFYDVFYQDDNDTDSSEDYDDESEQESEDQNGHESHKLFLQENWISIFRKNKNKINILG